MAVNKNKNVEAVKTESTESSVTPMMDMQNGNVRLS